jgi:ribosomal protein L11 methyltransferase
MLRTDPRLTDAVAAFLTGLTGAGLEITAAPGNQDQPNNSFFPEIITAYLPVGQQEFGEETAAVTMENLKVFLADLPRYFPECPVPELHFEVIMEEDWGQEWKKFFTTLQVTPTLAIKPSWEEAAETEQRTGRQEDVIVMDPGLAFGTGHHASTQLALLLLEELIRPMQVKPATVLDVGTGSGILAMACALFGAREIMAVDTDPDAVETATENIARNRLHDRITVSGQAVASFGRKVDIVVANITHDILAEMVNHLAELVAQDGFLVLSGILKDGQEESIRRIYSQRGFKLMKNQSRDDWVALLFSKQNR